MEILLVTGHCPSNGLMCTDMVSVRKIDLGFVLNILSTVKNIKIRTYIAASFVLFCFVSRSSCELFYLLFQFIYTLTNDSYSELLNFVLVANVHW